jgi:hypothetical protein
MGGGLELAQQITPSRHAHIPDGIVKASGALLGAVFAMLADCQRVPRSKHGRARMSEIFRLRSILGQHRGREKP